MSYGPRSPLPVHGSIKWISDINYHRVYRFLQDCIRLDPPNRFFSRETVVAPGIGCTPVSSDTTMAGLMPARPGKMLSVEALIISDKIVNDLLASLSVLRRPVASDVLSRSSGNYELILFGRDRKELRRIHFDPTPVSEQKKEEEFVTQSSEGAHWRHSNHNEEGDRNDTRFRNN